MAGGHRRGECVGRTMRSRIQRPRGAHVAAGGTSDTEIDTTGRERFEHPELLGHFQRAVVRQHDAGTADADPRASLAATPNVTGTIL